MGFEKPTDAAINFNMHIREGMLDLDNIERLDFLELVCFIANRWKTSIILSQTNDQINTRFDEASKEIQGSINNLIKQFKKGEF